MSTTARRLTAMDRPAVQALLKSRVDAGETLFDKHTRLDELNLDYVYDQVQTYHQQYLFGVWRDDKLRVMTHCRPIDTCPFAYMMLMVLSEKTTEVKPVNASGFNDDTQLLMTYCLRAMERKGRYVFYSVRPIGRHWRRTHENPERRIQGEYRWDVLEEIPAGETPKSGLAQMFLNRTYQVPLALTRYRRIGGSTLHA